MVRLFVVFCALILSLSACSFFTASDIHIVDAKIVTAVNEKLMPVQITNTFPKGTSKVVCWFQWKDAKVHTQIMSKWHYVTNDIHILDYPFYIPEKMGTGSVELSSPKGKTLPVGNYQVQLLAGNHALKSLAFKIE